jgi:hypothetical protein
MVSLSPSHARSSADSLAFHTATGVAFALLVTEDCRPRAKWPRSDLITTRSRNSVIVELLATPLVFRTSATQLLAHGTS